MSAYIAERRPKSIRIWTAAERPALVATIRLADHGSVDRLLRSHGWRRVGPWAVSDDMPAGHRVASVAPAATVNNTPVGGAS